MSRLISRDPFAREELHRETIRMAGCAQCGNSRELRNGGPRALITGRKFLYRYFVESDSGRRAYISGAFCSIGCMRAYRS